jgi:hypothetical protein
LLGRRRGRSQRRIDLRADAVDDGAGDAARKGRRNFTVKVVYQLCLSNTSPLIPTTHAVGTVYKTVTSRTGTVAN